LLHVTSSYASNFPDFYQMTEQDTIDVSKALIAHGAKVNYVNKSRDTALIEAAFACLPKLTAALIESGADVNAGSQDDSALHRVRNVKEMPPAECGETEHILLAHGAK